MRTITKLLILLLLLSCSRESKQININDMDEFSVFNKSNHLKPEFDKLKFDSLHDWELGWEILKPIDKAKSDEHEKELSKQFSPGQKALYFFWYLDAQVTNGGFIQFYWNGYRRYLPTILKGLELLEDKDLIGLITKVDKEYLSNLKTFEKHRELNDWEPLYKNLTEFEKYDSIYYSIHDNTMKKIEKYIRLHPDDFVTLK